jgi:23S rRNA (cytidine1920-2'-O)/16S rRNA (cytidine1409-2'-O)-methyltransferase
MTDVAPTQERLDKIVTARGLAPSRERAQLLIRKGLVQVDGKVVDRASELISDEADIVVTGEALPYVSRGGLKIAAVLDRFKINVTNFNCLDVGISTGGFADCLLQRGAKHVVGVDVGHGQLHQSLQNDPRITLHEGVNARNLTEDMFPHKFDLAAVDVAFISLTLVLPPIVPHLKPGSWLIALIKPEFEAGRDAVGYKGIVRKREDRKKAIERVVTFAKDELGLKLIGHILAPRLGGSGNEEYISAFRVFAIRENPAPQSPAFDVKDDIEAEAA